MDLLRKQSDGAGSDASEFLSVSGLPHKQGAGEFVKVEVWVRLKKARHDRTDKGLNIFGGGSIVYMIAVRSG
ncbi:hypothetical protein HA45_12915 [Pantoea rodasii]|nr:hypothetical protein HA45_12915 [Pantoea rodasii]